MGGCQVPVGGGDGRGHDVADAREIAALTAGPVHPHRPSREGSVNDAVNGQVWVLPRPVDAGRGGQHQAWHAGLFAPSISR